MTNKHYKKTSSGNYNTKHTKSQKKFTNKPSSKKEIYANIPNRDIYPEKSYRIISKEDIKKSDLDKTEIIVPLNSFFCNFPHNYSLANIPIDVERASLQSYHFPFTREQLGAMFTAPKVAVDRFHNTYVFNNEIMHRTSFYLVAPNRETNFYKMPIDNDGSYNILNESEIPVLYRFSICRSLKNKEHYSISMHAILGGKEDGFLFLARLDNNNTTPHDFVSTNENQAFFKKHSAVPVTANFTDIHKKMMQYFEDAISEEHQNNLCGGVIHRIAFPHIHQADPTYQQGDEPEKSCPKFLKKCASNTLEQNIAFMMKAFHICDMPEFYKTNERLKKIIEEKRNTIYPSDEPNSKYFVEEMQILEQCNSQRDFELIKSKITKKETKKVEAEAEF